MPLTCARTYTRTLGHALYFFFYRNADTFHFVPRTYAYASLRAQYWTLFCAKFIICYHLRQKQRVAIWRPVLHVSLFFVRLEFLAQNLVFLAFIGIFSFITLSAWTITLSAIWHSLLDIYPQRFIIVIWNQKPNC